MTVAAHTERDFETAIEAGLTGPGGYEKRSPGAYDEALALFPADVTGFLKESQPARWRALEALLGPKTPVNVLDSLSKELELKGTLHVLRHGFKCYGKTFRMAWFRPNTRMNPEAGENYARNRVTVTRQVAFASVMKKADGKNRRCIIDLTLAVNGIPVVTAELKNPLTGQRAADAMRQYEDERDGRDLLFAFKKRALVHFAVDTDEVWMTTQLKGRETAFLPFNRGHGHGAGNPPVEGTWKTHYLWDEVLEADSLLEILQRFMHLEVKETQVRTDKGARTVRTETMIFPRYHQLDSVRKLVAHAKAHGAGRNYLIQHSAGSGKSNSIAWLAHRLASLHDEHDEKTFHSVVVVTDRRVLDQQLQATIYQFEHKTGVVEKIDEDTKQLARALSQGTPIVITTIQKFPFISQALSTLEEKGAGVTIDTAGKRFAVIVDEAHSSQSGETATVLKGMLNKDGIEAAIAAQLSDEEDHDLSDDAKAAVLRDALQRARQPNLTFFAFTATPKFKTKALFDEPGPSGASPFHEYAMRQAIEEGFIMDVLQNYTTYKRFFGLIKQVENDPDVPRREAAKVLTRYLELHPVNIEQVVSVIVEHFRLNAMRELGGRAKAMVVTGSRLAAVKYKLAFDRYVGVEVEGENAVEDAEPLQAAAAVRVVDERRRAVQQVAAVDGAQIREVDDRVTVRVPAPEVVRTNLNAAEVDGGLVGVDDARRRVLLVADHVLPRVLVGDDIRRVNEPDVAAGVIAVVVRVDDVADRLVGHLGHPRLDAVDVARELVVDQDDALGRHAHAHVPADPVDVVESVLHRRHAQRLRLLARHDDDDCRGRGERSHDARSGNATHVVSPSRQSPDEGPGATIRTRSLSRRPDYRPTSTSQGSLQESSANSAAPSSQSMIRSPIAARRS